MTDQQLTGRGQTHTHTHTKRDARSTVVRQLNRCAPCAVCVNHHVISGLFLAGQACWVLILIDVVDGQHETNIFNKRDERFRQIHVLDFSCSAVIVKPTIFLFTTLELGIEQQK